MGGRVLTILRAALDLAIAHRIDVAAEVAAAQARAIDSTIDVIEEAAIAAASEAPTGRASPQAKKR